MDGAPPPAGPGPISAADTARVERAILALHLTLQGLSEAEGSNMRADLTINTTLSLTCRLAATWLALAEAHGQTATVQAWLDRAFANIPALIEENRATYVASLAREAAHEAADARQMGRLQ